MWVDAYISGRVYLLICMKTTNMYETYLHGSHLTCMKSTYVAATRNE